MTRYDETRTRRLVAYVLAGGLLVSVGLCAVFYLLPMTIQPPAALQPGSTLSINDWIYAYTNWTNTQVAYTEAYNLSLIPALGFAVAFGIFIAPRLALLASFALLNMYFAWTSHVIRDISVSLNAGLGQVIVSQTNFLWSTASLRYLVPSFIVTIDLEPLALLGALIALTFLLNRGVGTKKAVLLSLQVAALSLAILGTEIGIFDRNELFLHVTRAQVLLSFMPWFTNADLLLSGVGIFAVSTCLLRFPRILRQRRY